jgi:hypothetical protein
VIDNRMVELVAHLCSNWNQVLQWLSCMETLRKLDPHDKLSSRDVKTELGESPVIC